MSNNETNDPNKDKSWLHSEIYDRPRSAKNPVPRTSMFKFGSLGDILSSGIRIIVQSLFSGFLFIMLLFLFGFVDPEAENAGQYFLGILEIIGVICVTSSVFLAVRIFDGSDISELGLQFNRQAFFDFSFGFLACFIIITLKFLMLWAAGLLVIAHTAWEAHSSTYIFWNMLAILLIYLLVGWNEELLSRGFHLRLISKGLNRPLGVLISSAIFSYTHRDNPGVTPSYLAFVFLFGVIMCYTFLRTGQLWLAIGFHAGWDFFVTAFWGEHISDLKSFHLFDFSRINNPFFFLTTIAELAIIMILIRAYTSNRKPEIVDW